MAAEIDGVVLVEGHTLGEQSNGSGSTSSMLLDLKHLSTEGHRTLADLLAPRLRRALDMEAVD